MQFLVIAGLIALGAFVPGFAKFFMYLVFFPLFALFFGCLIWLVGCFLTMGGWMNMEGFATAMLWGCFPAIMVTFAMDG